MRAAVKAGAVHGIHHRASASRPQCGLGAITAQEAETLERYEELRRACIMVDDFPPDDRPPRGVGAGPGIRCSKRRRDGEEDRVSELVLLAVDDGVATLSLQSPAGVQCDGRGDDDPVPRGSGAGRRETPRCAPSCCAAKGKAFLAGGDVALFHQRIEELPDMIVRWGREMHFAILALRRAAKPVLASVHGACAGAGFSILCAADLAVAADNAHFSLAYAKIGASPDGGSTHFLPRLVGYKKAMELTLLADRFDANKARDLGLVNWVVPADQLARRPQRIARELAQRAHRRLWRSQAADEPVARAQHRHADGRGAGGVRALREDARSCRGCGCVRREAQAGIREASERH